MKLHRLDRSNLQNNSFSVNHNSYPNFLRIWHCHEELELVLILESTGTLFIGDGIQKFKKNELVLIGKNLPHMWRNDDIYFDLSSNLKAEAISIHFKKDFLGLNFFQSPEMSDISNLLERSGYGIKFSNYDPKIIEKVKKLNTLNGFEKFMELMAILNILAKHNKYELLSSEGFLNSFNRSGNKNLDKIYSYIFKNFNKTIKLKDVAEVANMNPSSFSRFFRSINRKTFSRYLNEIRVGYACKLLQENKFNIATICYDSGFNNLSNFNRQFKIITNMSPSEYIQFHNKPK